MERTGLSTWKGCLHFQWATLPDMQMVAQFLVGGLTVDSCPEGLHGCNRLWSWDLEDSDWSFASTNRIWLVVSNSFYFHSYFGKISNLTNIFQMG